MFESLKEKSFWRHLLPVIFPFVLFTLISIWGLYYVNQQNQLANLSRHADHTLSIAGGMIRDELTRVTTDITFLMQSSALRRFIKGKDNSKQLGVEWQRFMVLKKRYDQIRLLDTKGKEELRIEYHNGQPISIPMASLQDKSKRYYFKEAMALKSDEIYASPLDLNVENGRVVEPYQPTMRFAIQVTDQKNRLRGVLIINYSAHHILHQLHKLSMNKEQAIFLVNDQGHWLLGPERQMEWGFMFPESVMPNSRIQAIYPDAWTQLHKQQSGISITGEKVIAFHNLRSGTSKIKPGILPLLPFTGTDFPWTILAVLDRDMTVSGSGSFIKAGWPILVILALIVIVTVSAATWHLIMKLYSTERAGQNAKAEADRLQTIFANLREAILLLDDNKSIVSCNPAAEHMFSIHMAQLQQLSFNELIPQLPINEKNGIYYPMQPGIYNTEIGIGNGHTRIPVDITVYDIRNDDKYYSMLIVHDARDRLDSEQRMRYLTSHDLLTGLPNRFTLEEETRGILHNALQYGRQLALLHIDLDNFKQVIDTRGHRTGDEFLKRVAERLNLGLPETSHIGRLGNDEFIILLPEINDQSEASDLASRIIKLIAKPFSISNTNYHIGVSIGISFAPMDSDSVDMLFQHASTARHKAKSQGGNTFVIYDPVMNQEAKRLLTFENELRQAQDEKQFLLYYQPKQELANGQISGVEALLRWEHPREGLLVPHAFIDKLEHSQELIIEVGYWVMEEACNTIVEWNLLRIRNMQKPLTMAVNFSSMQFRDMDMVNRIRSILSRTSCEANWLEIEVTESVLMDNLDSAERRLWSLHDTGVSIAIDDFGIGYSSLSYLKKLPVKVLKIDRSFVSGLPDDKDDCAIVQATVTMAKHMGLSVVAEGVETEAHYKFLKNIDVDYMQGYWYARPMRKEKIEADFLKMSAQDNQARVINFHHEKNIKQRK